MDPTAEVLDALAAIGVEWREDDGPHAYFRNTRADNADHAMSEVEALLRECRAALAPIAAAYVCGDHIYRPLIHRIDVLLGQP